MICRTTSKACKLVSNLDLSASIYSDSLFVSNAILAKLTVETLILPTLRAVPPIELKSSYPIFL